MSRKKQISKIAPLLLIPFSLLSANETVCRDDASYFQKHFVETKNPESFNLQWAECEEKLGNKEGAMSAYERVLMYNPNNTKATIALAKLYQKNNMEYESKELMHTVDHSRLTPQQRQIVSTLVDKKRSLVSTRFSATLSFGHDDNLNFGIYREASTEEGDIGSAFHSFNFSGNYVHELEDTGGYSFQSNLNLYWQDNYSAHYYDTLYGSIDAGLGYSTSNISLYLPIVYRRMNYLDLDLYEQYGIAPSLTSSLGDGLLFNVELKYLERRYIDTLYKNADDTLSSISLGLYKFYGENYIYAQAIYNSFDAKSADPTPFTEYDYLQLFIGASYEIEGLAIAGITYQYGHRTFGSEVILEENIDREDDFNYINLSLQRELTKELKILANYTYAKNESNYESASYNKQTISIGLQYNY
ncbi:MAG: surface lipoprotein assembly modifier [Campylobacterota bacterium]|nr:surface lipoprotein assembly modifier [Campylobacterota bacterium]